MVPRALIPWRFTLAIVLAIVLFVALPAAVAGAVVVALILLMVGTIGFKRYQWLNRRDDFKRPRNEELVQSFDTLVRPSGSRDDQQPSSESPQR